MWDRLGGPSHQIDRCNIYIAPFTRCCSIANIFIVNFKVKTNAPVALARTECHAWICTMATDAFVNLDMKGRTVNHVSSMLLCSWITGTSVIFCYFICTIQALELFWASFATALDAITSRITFTSIDFSIRSAYI